MFLNAFFNIGDYNKKEGWFSVEDIPLTYGIDDPAAISDKKKFESIRLQLSTTVSLAGTWGEFLVALEKDWKKESTRITESEDIGYDGQKIHPLMQYKLSMKHAEKPGAPIGDPIIRFKIDFGKFPQRYKYKFLVGQPRTQIYDYRTRQVDEKGRETFKLATVTNEDGVEELVNASNIHLFVTSKSILRKGRVMIPSAALSSNWLSMPMVINRAIIEPGPDEGFSDEYEEVEAETETKTETETSEEVGFSDEPEDELRTTTKQTAKSSSDADIDNLLAVL